VHFVTRRRWRHASRTAPKELTPDVALELGDLHAQRWLNDIESLSGARDRLFFVERHKVLYLFEVHVDRQFWASVLSDSSWYQK
jgi:hypothetical protein